MLLSRLGQLLLLPAEPISTIKIVVKVSGKRPLDLPRSLSEVSLEAKTSNRRDAISLKRDRLRALLDKLPTGSKDLSIVCVAGTLFLDQFLIDSVSAAANALMGDSAAAQANQEIHDKGKAQQRSAEQ